MFALATNRWFPVTLAMLLSAMFALTTACGGDDDDDDETQGDDDDDNGDDDDDDSDISGCAVNPDEAGNIVSNSSFEEPVVTTPEHYLPLNAGDTIGEWDVIGKGVDLVGDRLQAGHGVQSVDLNNYTDHGGVEQALPTTPGQSYNLSFCYAGNTEGGEGIKEFEIFWGETSLGSWTFDTTGYTPTNMGWITTIIEVPGDFTASDTTTLKFVSLQPVASVHGPEIDAVVVVPAE
ncbi:MAG: DUF642 domain-containing protein [Deltaproteobacteria bacterium]|nr:DUF642 domain-containing protein [bacterium]MCB9477533.1 DUF642 domain-containing protein [Deltaproteobacteria bacterium]MCB9487602.1 DUF642 domain-containing protein [Deltaproteobacteria bacterium]